MLKNIILIGLTAVAMASPSISSANNIGYNSIVSVTAESLTSFNVVKTGSFEGRNDHITTGDISIVKTADGYIAILNQNFSLDGAPAPTLGFGKNGFDKKTEFTKLESKSGLQIYKIPANINVDDFDEFYVWCADFNVALGVASLK